MANCIENISTKEEDSHQIFQQTFTNMRMPRLFITNVEPEIQKVEDIILNNKVQSDLLRKQIHEVVISGLVKP